MRNPNPNIEGAIANRKRVSKEKKEAVKFVLNKLIALNDPLTNPISKAEICRQANVSETFLRNHKEELLKPIDEAIESQNQKIKVISKKRTFTESSKDKVIDSLKRRLEKLEIENKKVKSENAILIAKIAKC